MLDRHRRKQEAVAGSFGLDSWLQFARRIGVVVGRLLESCVMAKLSSSASAGMAGTLVIVGCKLPDGEDGNVDERGHGRCFRLQQSWRSPRALWSKLMVATN